MRFLPMSSVRIEDSAIMEKQRLVRDVVLHYQWETLNDRVPGAAKSFAMHNFRVAAGQISGKRGGMVFQDTDVYKWIEAVAYSLETERSEYLEARADEAIDIIASAQENDGYLDTYYTLVEPQNRWQNLMEGHELYCAGHMMEAAVAYFQATGKRKLLDCAILLADCIDRYFGKGKCEGYPGHPEVELALVRMYETTGERRYLDLARFFVKERGTGNTKYFTAEMARPGHTFIWEELEGFGAGYAQWQAPVTKQTEATGHAVRAMYLYCAMADIARIDGDTPLKGACEQLFKNVTEKKMYVTGGIGSAAAGEQFTADYDLPADSAYCESCASVGLMRFALRMTALTGDLTYYNTWQRAFENTVEAGLGRDGRHFFYVNPLSANPGFIARNPTLKHVAPSRELWFGVSCCPPNIARTVMSLGGDIFARDESAFYILSHTAASFDDGVVKGRLTEAAGEYTLTLSAPPCEIILRVPEGYQFAGKARVAHAGGEMTYRYTITPVIRLLRAHPYAADCAGKICVLRGETVYCLEEADNGQHLSALLLDPSAPLVETTVDFLPPSDKALKGRGYRQVAQGLAGKLYTEEPPAYESVPLLFVPYREWNNRGEGEMTVWVREYHP